MWTTERISKWYKKPSSFDLQNLALVTLFFAPCLYTKLNITRTYFTGDVTMSVDSSNLVRISSLRLSVASSLARTGRGNDRGTRPSIGPCLSRHMWHKRHKWHNEKLLRNTNFFVTDMPNRMLHRSSFRAGFCRVRANSKCEPWCTSCHGTSLTHLNPWRVP